jgi:HD-like signal output (HDOD) protein
VPPFPAIAHRILALISQEDVDTRKVSELIKMDPSFSAELLRYANSPLFGVRREVTGLTQAVVLLGTERVRTMAMLVSLNKMVRGAVRIDILKRVWAHSLVTAIIGDESARLARTAGDTAYTAGLLHNLGALGIMCAYPEEYARMLLVSDDFGFDLLRTERDLFEIDHCAAGAYLAQDWDFPDELAATIATHHDAPVAGDTGVDNLIRIAWRMADTLGFAAFSCEHPWAYEDLLQLLPDSKTSWLTEGWDSARAELDARLAAAPL